MSHPRNNTKHAAELLNILTAPVTDFDCGTLCAPGNGGVPVCCHAESVVPVLYKSEFEVLKRRTKLWRKYQPRTAHQRGLNKDMRSCDMLAVCKGAEFCERDNRSIVCRTFPFEPYLDHDGVLAGLVYNFEYLGTCPLVGSKHKVLPEFVDQSMQLWDRMFDLWPTEQDFYFLISQTIRRSFGQRRKTIPVHTRTGIRQFRTTRA